ncbi:hypothetical protein C3486_20770 [Streptomyces sp. Ru73]|uniref:hypothetical protein n=1 Tax=Streptomyces sp. Ru73 TaxID=2080748 RepID=UPI000CDDDDC3|nr:hypothetical protein [Streptomyces sp. Ru73]POX38904.1 hypothetical protein C3486_20770 [Streptomyces sp. Ru73]
MSPQHGPDGPAAEAGLDRLEGYLLCWAEAERARADAVAFADRLPWLTTAQREEVIRHYTADRVAVTRRYFERVRDRSGELREEYTARYRELRHRLVCGAVAAALSVCALLGVLAGLPADGW